MQWKKSKKIFQGIGCRQCEKIKIITINRIVRTHPIVRGDASGTWTCPGTWHSGMLQVYLINFLFHNVTAFFLHGDTPGMWEHTRKVAMHGDACGLLQVFIINFLFPNMEPVFDFFSWHVGDTHVAAAGWLVLLIFYFPMWHQ